LRCPWNLNIYFFLIEVAWSASAKPPTITVAVIELLDDLSAIDTEMGQERLTTLVNSLITTPPTSSSCASLQEAVQNCKNAESMADLQDFRHIFALVQAAFWIEE
jgi:hypothetical protein